MSSSPCSISLVTAGNKLHRELTEISNPRSARALILRDLLSSVDTNTSANLVHLLCSRRSQLSPVARDDRDKFAASLLTVFCHIPVEGDRCGRALKKLLGMLVHLDADDLASPDDLLRVDSVTSAVLVTFCKNTPEAVKLTRNFKKLVRFLWMKEGRTVQFDSMASQAKGAAAQMLKAHVLKLLECIYTCTKIDSESPRKKLTRTSLKSASSSAESSMDEEDVKDITSSPTTKLQRLRRDQQRMSSYSTNTLTRQVSLSFICKTVAQATQKKFPDRAYHSALCSLLFLRLVNPDILQQISEMQFADDSERENSRKWAVSMTKLIQAISNRAVSTKRTKEGSGASYSTAIQLTPFQSFIESQSEDLLECIDSLVESSEETEIIFPRNSSMDNISSRSNLTLSPLEENQILQDCASQLDLIVDWIRKNALAGVASKTTVVVPRKKIAQILGISNCGVFPWIVFSIVLLGIIISYSKT
jgi:hypothetical protein